MKKFRLLSAFLAVVMASGMLPAMPVLAAGDAETTTAVSDVLVPGFDEETGLTTINYLTQKFKTPEDKLATMTKYLTKGDVEFYVEPISGEVAYVNTKTDQILFSNPYDVSDCGAIKSTKQELLSQIIIKYTDNGKEMKMTSFVEACQRGQIKVKKIKNGVRVEYVIGREETRKLVPRYISKERYETLIYSLLPEGKVRRHFNNYYTLQDALDPSLSDRVKQEIIAKFPVCEDMAIYTFDAFAGNRELTITEEYIKTYCPEYTYETLAEDHNMTGYVGKDKAPPLFRLALEYSLDENGALDVRLPANGIRFDENVYQLDSVSLLPWFGAATSEYEGYTFIPDGSGALVRFEDIGDKPLSLTSKLYGQDYAYQTVSGQNKEVMRMPVYGVVESDVFIIPELTEEQVDAGEVVVIPTEYKQSTGFVAIIEEGDSLAEVTTEHGGALHKYNSVYTSFAPRPKDTYNMDESISVGSNSEYTIVSERKYTGSYRIKYTMLTSKKTADEVGLEDYYVDSYVGMAKAYRDYLISKGVLKEFEATDVEENIPLYIESFGAIETTERVLSVPVQVLKPLTSFEDLKAMYGALENAGITNVNYKLTGFANGGMYSTVPNRVNFEKAVGGNSGYKDLMAYAEEKGIGVYPDFDFAYMNYSETFDGFSAKKHLVKAMDNRYSTKQIYDAAWQEFLPEGGMVITPSVYDDFFKGLKKDFDALNPMGISVSTLGTDLNSDFDKKDPYNREDSKHFTAGVLEDMDESYDILLDGGNAYTLAYADHIVNVSLDSSRYSRASESVPFVGMVLHGCVNFAGGAINMAGDTKYELLKAIENGSSPYFVLSMNNTELLKEHDKLSKYYSVDFDIWYEELVEIYDKLNSTVANLQDKQIVDHEFLIGERVPTAEELEADKEEIAAAEAAQAELEKEWAEKTELSLLLEERLAALGIKYTPKYYGPEEGPQKPGQEGYKYTKYTSDDGRIVKVTYEDGTAFILNYNNFDITVEDDGKTYSVAPLDFVVAK